jgi:hypothetical protein
MNDKLFHLIAFCVSLAALVILVVTGHDNSVIVTGLLAGLAGGSGGQTFGNVLSLAPSTSKQAGFIKVPFALFAFVLTVCFAALVGCGSVASQTPTQKIEYACATASASLKALTPLESSGVLSAGESDVVARAVQVMKPVCNSPTPPTYPDVAYSALTEAIADLNELQLKYHVVTTQR